MVVVSPEYGLAPDVTIVDQIAECVAVAEWLGLHAAAEFGPETLLIGGISAGGHLAAATLLRDESILMAQRWQLAGSQADVDVWREGAHAFANMATPLGELAFDRTTAWITSILDK